MTLCGVPIHRAVGRPRAFGVDHLHSWHDRRGDRPAGTRAHLPPYSLGYVNLLGFILIAPASYIVAP